MQLRPLCLAVALATLCASCSGQTPKVNVTGKVVLDGETDSSGIRVSLAGRAAVTAADGSYHFELLSGGTYALRASADATREGAVEAAVEAPEEGTVTVPDLKLTPVGDVEGTVTLGTSTGNAGISVMSADGAALAVTDDAGHYVLHGVPTGSRQLVASAPGYAQSPFTVQVSRGGKASASPLALSRPANHQFTGKALLLGAASHADTVVTLQGTERTTTTAADGSFTLNGVPDGVYTLLLRNGTFEESVPGVAVIQGSPYVSSGSTLVPLQPLTLQPARRLASADTVGVAPSMEAYAPNPLLQLTTDKSRVVFLADTTTQLTSSIFGGITGLNAVGTLKVAPTAAGGTPLTLATSVTSFELSADGTRVLFTRNDGSLYFGSLVTGDVTPLASSVYNASNLNAANTSLYAFNPDASRALFLRDGVLHLVNSSGGAATVLGNASTGYSSPSDPGLFTSDGRVFFGTSAGLMLADPRQVPLTPQLLTSSLSQYRLNTDRTIALMLDAGSTTFLAVSRLGPSGWTTTGIDTSVSGFSLSPDGQRAVYFVQTLPATMKALLLSSNIPVNLGTYNTYRTFSQDNQQVLFVDRDANNNTYSVVSANANTGVRNPIWTNASYPNTSVYSPNGDWVVIQADTALYSASTKGAGSRTITSPSAATFLGYRKIAISPSSDRVAYILDTSATPRSLQLAPLTVTSVVQLGPNVSDFTITPDGTRIVFLADGSLRSALMTSTGSSTLLADNVRTYVLSPDGSWVLYVDMTGLARATRLVTGETRVLGDRVSRALWVDNTQAVLVRDGATAGLEFQDGVYLAPLQ